MQQIEEQEVRIGGLVLVPARVVGFGPGGLVRIETEEPPCDPCDPWPILLVSAGTRLKLHLAGEPVKVAEEAA